MSSLKKELYELVKNDVVFFDFIQEQALDGLCYLNKTNEENEWKNSKFWSTLGYENDKISPKISNLLESEDLQLFKHIDFNTDSNLSLVHTLKFKHKNGNTVVMRCQFLPIKDDKNESKRALIGFTNLSNSHQPTVKDIKINEQQLKLKKQEDFLEKCNLAAKIGYWEVDLHTQNLYWSSMTKLIHEANQEYEPNIKTALNLYKEGESRTLISNAFNLAVSDGSAFDHELQILTLQDNIRWVRSIGQAEFQDGVCSRIYGTFQDITAEKESSIALLQEKEKLQSVIHSTNSGPWEWNIQTGETQHSELWAKIIGYTLNEIEPINTEKWTTLVHPDDLELSNESMKACFEKKAEFYHSEYRIKHKNGNWIWVLDKGKIISWTEDSKPLMMFGTHTDISEQKKSELKLEETLNKIQGILDASTQVSIIETDLEGTITTFNKGAQNLLGYSKEEVLNIKTPALFHVREESLEREEEIFQEFGETVHDFGIFTFEANKGNFDTREWNYVKKNGTQFPVQLTITSVKTNGKIAGYLGIAVDISSLKNAEKEIQSLLQVTKGQNERLKNFAHIVSHNLRSHSGNIAMMLDLLEFEYPELQENEFITLLDKASSNLKETIEHLNEVVLMNNSINENLQNLNLNEYLEKVLKGISVITLKSKVTIENKIDPNIKIQGIPAYLESILLNFITNGIKYKSDERDSFIKIHCTLEEGFVVLHIEDNGIGIDLKKNRSKLFGMYKTFHNNADARGIGLFITKNQVEALGGKIIVNSELNKGTTFKIYLKNEKN